MRRFLPLVLGLLYPALVSAESAWSVKFEPLFGVEHTSNPQPEPARYSTRSFFGLRVLAGVPLLSLELEGTQSNGRRDYPGDNQKIEDEVQRAMVGLRSTVPTTQWFAIFGRAGFRGTKQKTTITNTLDSTKEVKDPPIAWDPYAGAGAQLALGSLFAVSAGATWIFTDAGAPDVQYTLGATVKFGQVR